MKRTLLALALLLCSGGAPYYADEKPAVEKKTPAPADAPSLKLPATLNGDPGDFIQIAADTNGTVVVWRAVDPGLKLFPTNLLRDTRTAVVTAKDPGRYRVWAVTALGGVPSDIAECVVVVGTPGPVPPGPGPGPGPGPTPTPIPGVGFKAMIIYETADLGKLPSKQLQIIEAKAVRDYLNAKAVPTTDGGKRGWYITDQNADFSGESKVWQDAIKRPRTQVPWIVVGNGKDGYEGPLPADVPATLELLKKFGG